MYTGGSGSPSCVLYRSRTLPALNTMTSSGTCVVASARDGGAACIPGMEGEESEDDWVWCGELDNLHTKHNGYRRPVYSKCYSSYQSA